MVPFWIVWGGEAVSQFGSSLVQFALVWYLTQRTHSATVLATGTLVAMLPQIVLGPYAGALVDRWNRKVTMIVSDGAIALATLGMAALFALGVVEVWHVYVILLLRAVGALFQYPAFTAATTMMVEKEQLSRVNGLNQALGGAMQIIAPPLGALLLSLVPMQGVLAIDILTAVVAITPVLFIVIPQPERSSPAEKSSAWQDMLDGFRFVWGITSMVLIVAMSTLLNLFFNPAFALSPLLVSEHFLGGAPQLAWLESAMGVGFVTGGVLLGVWGGFKKRVVTAMTALVAAGALTAAVGLVPSSGYWISVALFFLIGVSMPIANGSFMAFLQAVVPPERQGRVIALVVAGATAASPLGLLVAGPVAEAISVQGWYVLAGAVCGLTALAMFLVPQVMNMEADLGVAKSEEGAAPAEEAAGLATIN